MFLWERQTTVALIPSVNRGELARGVPGTSDLIPPAKRVQVAISRLLHIVLRFRGNPVQNSAR